MRFKRLGIPAYGPFTELDIDFTSPEQADFHLIYGDNEAGKSSLLRAIRDLLYGIHAQTDDNFLHDYKDLRITAEIENRSGQRIAIQRRKGMRHTLLDAGGNPLDEAALAPFLGPVDREYFSAMFGLGSEELRQGAHDLLQGRGDLGQALFSASLAGSPIHHVLATLEAQARGLFSGRARIGVSLRPAIDAYEEALRASRQAQVKAETWEDTLRELASAQRVKDELDEALKVRRERLDWSRRCLDALPALGQLRDVGSRLEVLPELPELPAGFMAQAAGSSQRRVQAEQALSELRQSLEEQDSRRLALAPRASVLARAAEIETLVQNLAVRRQDREALAADQALTAQLQASLLTGLLELGLPDLGSPALGPELDVDLSRIALLRIPLEEELALRGAAAALLEAEQGRAEQGREAERLAVEMETTAKRLAGLVQTEAAALRAAQAASAPAAAWAQTLADKEEALDGLARSLASQKQWLVGAPSDAQETYWLALPAAARLREFEAAAAELNNRARHLLAAKQETVRKLRERVAGLKRLEQLGTLPTLADLLLARTQRDSEWRQVLARCQDEGARASGQCVPQDEVYSEFVRLADRLADRLREEADSVAQAQALRSQIEEAQAAAREHEEEEARLEQSRQTWQSDWMALWRASGLEAESPAEMLEWREQWSEFRKRHEAWHDLHCELQAGRERIALAVATLRPLLGVAEMPLLALRELAEQRLRAADQALGERRALEIRQAELTIVAEALARQGASLKDTLDLALARWRQLRLGGETCPEVALPLLEARLKLVAQYDTWARLMGGLAARKTRVEDYEHQVEDLVSDLDLAGANAEVQINALGQALVLARALQSRRAQVEEDLERLEASLPRVEREAHAACRDLDAILAQAGVADPAALQDMLADLGTRQRLGAERDRLRASLHTQARGESLDDFIERVAGESQAGGASLAAQWEELVDRIKELEGSREQAIQSLARCDDARRALEASGAGAALQLQAARHAAARIREDAARYLRLRLATQFLQAQIETFRERNQGPLLARAGALFRGMTDASFSGLGSDYTEADLPTLVGLKGGAKIPLAGMSEGTRDQLYLALRLAAIELHQASHEPMPLILDDLLMTFDDDRSRAILPMLAKQAENTQVLLFTHHRHLLDLARATLPAQAWRLHEIGPG